MKVGKVGACAISKCSAMVVGMIRGRAMRTVFCCCCLSKVKTGDGRGETCRARARFGNSGDLQGWTLGVVGKWRIPALGLEGVGEKKYKKQLARNKKLMTNALQQEKREVICLGAGGHLVW